MSLEDNLNSEHDDLFSPENIKKCLERLRRKDEEMAKVTEYDSRFSDIDVRSLKERGVHPYYANQFSKLRGFEIADLFESSYESWVRNNINIINNYPNAFSGIDIENALHFRVHPEDINVYLKNRQIKDVPFENAALIAFIGNGILFDVALNFWEHLPNKDRTVSKFNNTKRIDQPQQRCSFGLAQAISNIIKVGGNLEKALEYDPKYNAGEIAYMLCAGVSPALAEEYQQVFEKNKNNKALFNLSDNNTKRFHGYGLLFFAKTGLTPQVLEKSFKKSEDFNITLELLFSYFNSFTDGLFFNTDWTKHYPESFIAQTKIVGSGANALVFLDKKNERILKFDYRVISEYKLLRKILNSNPNGVFNVVNVKEKIVRDEPIFERPDNPLEEAYKKGNRTETYARLFEYAHMELEYIKGDSLENILKKKGILSADKVLKYSADILNGLYEMRQAGIWYHRDIRPANIMIDEEKDRAVIIDLGIATTDKNALPQGNTRFGAPDCDKDFLANDLISLGQMAYDMYVGKHLFAESESMTRTFSDIKEEIRDYRNRVYTCQADKTLVDYLRKVDQTVADPRVANLVKACLVADNNDHDIIRSMLRVG